MAGKSPKYLEIEQHAFNNTWVNEKISRKKKKVKYFYLNEMKYALTKFVESSNNRMWRKIYSIKCIHWNKRERSKSNNLIPIKKK